jgi:galactose-6-phosphate isomerase
MPKAPIAILTNPRFTETLTVARSAQTVGLDGIALNVATPQSFMGVVTPAQGTELRREAEGAKLSGRIDITTTFALQDADLVTWGGRKYTVSQVNDWSSYGFMVATADLVSLSGG